LHIEDRTEHEKLESIKLYLRELAKRMTFFDKNKPGSENERPTFGEVRRVVQEVTNELKLFRPEK
jgi:hypothetical protein